MSIQKTTIAATLLLALTACSGGGKNDTSGLESQIKNLQNKAELAQKKADQATKRAEDAEKNAKLAQQTSSAKLQAEVKHLKALADLATLEASEAKKLVESAKALTLQKVKGLTQEDTKLLEQVLLLKQQASTAQLKANEALKRAEQAEQNAKAENKSENQQVKSDIEKLKVLAELAQKQANEAKRFAESASALAEQKINEINQKNAKVQTDIQQLQKEALSAKQEAIEIKQFAESAQTVADQKIAELNKNNMDLSKDIQRLKEQAKMAQEQAKDAEKKALAAQNAALNAHKNPELLAQISALQEEASNAKKEAQQAKKSLENTLNNMDKRVRDALANIEQERKAKFEQLSQLAQAQGLPSWEISHFANDFLNQDLESAKAELAKRKAEQDKKRSELIELAKNSGLFSNSAEYENFANQYIHSDLTNAQDELTRQKENRERENKRLALIDMARNSGVFSSDQEYEFEYFANNYLYSTLDEAKENLASRKREKIRRELYELANNSGLNLNYDDVDHFVDQYETQSLTAANQELDRRKQEKRQTLIDMARNSGLFANNEEYENFAREHLSSEVSNAQYALDTIRSNKRERKRTEFIDLLHTYDYSYFNIGDPLTFVEGYLDSDINQFRAELDKRKKLKELTQLAQSYYYYLDTDERSFAERHLDSDFETVRNELERLKENKRQELINLARNSGVFSQESEYENFANEYLYRFYDAESELENRRSTQRENKRQELIQLAQSYSPYLDTDPNSFAERYLDSDIATAQNELERLKENIENAQQRENKRQELIQLADSYRYGLDIDPESFAERYLDSDINQARRDLERLSSERQEKITDLTNFAKERGLSENDASSFAQNYGSSQYGLEDAKNQFDDYVNNLALGQKQRVDKLKSITIDTPVGLSRELEKREIPLFDSNGFDTGKMKVEYYKDIYNQKYSAVVGEYNHYSYSSEPYYQMAINNPSTPYVSSTAGLFTQENHLPVEGTATYNGVAFTANKQGTLSYNVNFALKEGQGQITGLQGIDDIELQKGTIGKRYNNSMGIAGSLLTRTEDPQSAGYSGSYVLDFYGLKAEEISGVASFSGYTNGNVIRESGSYGDIKIGFGGTRGDIQK